MASHYATVADEAVKNRSFGDWEETFDGNVAPTNAMLERPLHYAHVIQIRCDSYRFRQARQSGHIGRRRAN